MQLITLKHQRTRISDLGIEATPKTVVQFFLGASSHWSLHASGTITSFMEQGDVFICAPTRYAKQL